MNDTPSKIRGLGEIALRVNDLNAMQQFYQEVIGLELMRRFENAAFFRIAEGYGGHTQILALFDRTEQPAPVSRFTTVDHLAFTIALQDFNSEVARLQSHNLNVRTTTHEWVQWRSLYVNDPEDNTVELVCFDPSI